MKKIVLLGILLVVFGVVLFVFRPFNNNNTSLSSIKKQSSSAVVNVASAENAAYTLDEVSRHNNQQDCWMAIHGNIYNVTDFISVHPGGSEILQGCGKDATSLFDSVDQHAREAVAILPTYLIGRVEQ